MIAILYLFSISQVSAATRLTVYDEVTMSRYLGASNSPDEWRLFIKLFPDSPYFVGLESRLFLMDRGALSFDERKKIIQMEEQDIFNNKSTSLTGVDEVTMSRLAQSSSDPKMYRLFLKIFPSSAFATIFKTKLSRFEKKGALEEEGKRKGLLAFMLPDPVDETEKTVKEIEETILAEESKKSSEAPTEQEATEAERKTPDQKEVPEAPEVDWSKYEIGIPTEIVLTDSSGSQINTTGSPTGIYLGWSSELWFDTGWGTGLDYFIQKLEDGSGEYQHLYLEAQIKGRIFKFINWGLGLGTGMTTLNLKDPSSITVVPGQGTIQSLSIGLNYGSLGLNMMSSTFSGALVWAPSSNPTNTTEVKWTGTVAMITLEYNY